MHETCPQSEAQGLGRGRALALIFVVFLALSPLVAIPSVQAAPKINIDVDSQVLVAGAENSIEFTISNSGDSTAQNINATVSIPTNNMLLIDSDGSWNVTDLNPGQSDTISVKAYITPSAAGSLLQITIRVMYQSGGWQTDTRTVGFSVAAVDLDGAYLYPHFATFDLQPSQNNTASLIIENQGGREATNISVSLGSPSGLGSSLEGLGALTSLTGTSSLSSGSTQFLLYNNTGRWTFDSIPANGSVTLPLTIFVMPAAAGAISMFPVTLTYTDGFTYAQVTRYAAVRVPSVPSSGISFHVGVLPQEFRSGETTHAMLNVTNMGPGGMDAVSVQLGLSGGTGGSGSITGSSLYIPSGSSSPFVLLGQDGSWFLGYMGAGESRLLPMDIYTAPSGSGTVTSVSVTVSYTDPLAKARQETKSIGVIVRGFVDIYVLDSSTFPQAIIVGKAFSASINIINLGTSAAKGMLVFPQGNQNLTSASAESIFLGDVEVNIPTSLTISYVASNITNGTYPITIPYTYKDSLGDWLNGTLTVPLRLRVSTGSETSQTNSGAGGIGGFIGAYWWALVIVAVLAASAIYLVLRRRKSRK